jgi:hypothetical protein
MTQVNAVLVWGLVRALRRASRSSVSMAARCGENSGGQGSAVRSSEGAGFPAQTIVASCSESLTRCPFSTRRMTMQAAVLCKHMHTAVTSPHKSLWHKPKQRVLEHVTMQVLHAAMQSGTCFINTMPCERMACIVSVQGCVCACPRDTHRGMQCRILTSSAISKSPTDCLARCRGVKAA